jgi:putative ABC transport system substrate-binding protein
MHFDRLKRRGFISLLGGAAAWSHLAIAQQDGRIPHLGILEGTTEDDRSERERLAVLRESLEKHGWLEGRNLRIDYRFAPIAGGEQAPARELVALKPDVIFAAGTPATAALRRETQTIPIVFARVSDPIGSGFAASLAHPGGNLTGLLYFEATVVGKWLAMLKEIAPTLTRVAFIANPKRTPYDYFLRGGEVAARSLKIELVPSPVETADDIEHVIELMAREPNSGLLFPPDGTTYAGRDRIIALVARHRLPAVYWTRYWVNAGGLMSYEADNFEIMRQAASYVDRILRGANPADLPVQTPVRYRTVLNLKTARALGLDVPPAILVAADEVIE